MYEKSKILMVLDNCKGISFPDAVIIRYDFGTILVLLWDSQIKSQVRTIAFSLIVKTLLVQILRIAKNTLENTRQHG